jgi:hypothetical protein
MIHRRCLLASLLLVAFSAAAAAQPVQRERVHFQRGHSDATITDHVTGRGSIEFLLGARAGQVLQVRISGSSNVAFNVFEPGKRPGRDAAVFRGEVEGESAELRLAQNGDYMIQVFQNRAAARRGGRAEFTLHVAITGGEAAAATAPSGDARVAGTNFNATGNLPCARAASQPMAQCRFGVVRRGQGAADVTVFWPDGGSRVLFFEGGRPVRFDQSQADGNARLTSSKQGDLFTVRVGSQRFEIPEAVITGG